MSLIINKQELLRAAPIKNMLTTKEVVHGMSYGLGEAGYDIRLKQDIKFTPHSSGIETPVVITYEDDDNWSESVGRFTIGSSIEEFDMPADMVGFVKDKSSWARQGISVFNTVIEPGWRGFLTIELVFHGPRDVHIPAGCPIAQVLFQNTVHAASYAGKYQDQADRPVEAIYER